MIGLCLNMVQERRQEVVVGCWHFSSHTSRFNAAIWLFHARRFALDFLSKLAASIPRTEIVGKSDNFRFGMRDSLAIEASFLQAKGKTIGTRKTFMKRCQLVRKCSTSSTHLIL